ncbi:uncharacterized protein CBL_06290 [Carabus blaptoides fortunei]
MVENPNGPFQHQTDDPDQNDVEMEEVENYSDNEEDSYLESEEFEAIDNQLDMLNSVLDSLEQKNDGILAELKTLLHENREIRKQLQECRVEEQNQPQESN